jgi:hypothetical protein
MKKLLFLLCLIPLSIFAQNPKPQAIPPPIIVPKAIVSDIISPFNFEVIYDDTMRIKDMIIKKDSFVYFFEMLIRPDLSKPYLNDISPSDTFSTNKKLGVLEFTVSKYSLENWRKFKTRATTQKSEDVKQAEAEKIKQDRIIQRQKDKENVLKKDKT